MPGHKRLLRNTALRTALALAFGLALQAAPGVAFAQVEPATAGAKAGPALWVVRDPDSTVYLFGTVHALKDSTAWRTPRVEAALEESQEVWLEIAEIGDAAGSQAAATPLIQSLGLDPARPLSGKLSEEDRKRLDAAAVQLGMTPAQFEPMRPWLAAVMLAVVPMVQAGFDPELGVDNLVARAARAEGKPVKAFETTEQQLRFFADLPLAVEVQMLHEALDDIGQGPELLDQLSAAWAAGDTEKFEDLFVDEMKADSPELYKVLVADRNEAWARAIAERMKGSGVSFVAVGAGHLAGPDSVQAKLAERGIEAERR